MFCKALAVAVFAAALASACSRGGASSPTPVNTPASAPVAAPGVILNVISGNCCNRSPAQQIPWVDYAHCGDLRIAGTTASMTYYETMSVYGPDDAFYFSRRM